MIHTAETVRRFQSEVVVPRQEVFQDERALAVPHLRRGGVFGCLVRNGRGVVVKERRFSLGVVRRRAEEVGWGGERFDSANIKKCKRLTAGIFCACYHYLVKTGGETGGSGDWEDQVSSGHEL